MVGGGGGGGERERRRGEEERDVERVRGKEAIFLSMNSTKF